MESDRIRAALRKQPFEPFRMHLSNGDAYDVRHPEFAMLTRRTVYIGLPVRQEDIADRPVECDILHVVAIAPIDGAPTPKSGSPPGSA